MIWQLDIFLFVMILILAVLALWVRDLLAAVPLLSAFSLVVAVMFAGLEAVDVAFVEAVLGAGLTGLLLLLLIRATGERADAKVRPRVRWSVLPIIGVFLALMIYASGGLPDRGDPESPATTGVAREYLERSLPETKTENVVTSVLADFRSQDTLGEVVVIFTAGTAVLLILAGLRPSRRSDEPADDGPEGPGPAGTTGGTS